MTWRVRAGGRSAGSSAITYTHSGLPLTGVFVGTYGPAGQFLYQDGLLRASNASNTGALNNTINDIATFAGLGGQTFDFGGKIDFIILYNKAFSSQEVKEATADPFAPFRVNLARRVAILAPQAIGGLTGQTKQAGWAGGQAGMAGGQAA